MVLDGRFGVWVRPSTCAPRRRHIHYVGSLKLRKGLTDADERNIPQLSCVVDRRNMALEVTMNGVIYLVGLIVVVLAILSFFGLR